MPGEAPPAAAPLDCPSAQPELPNARVFGVVTELDGQDRVAYLERAVPVTRELLERAAPLDDPTRVLRIAASCQKSACPHFEDSRCSLAEKAARLLAPVVDAVAPCAIRKTCRWFAEHGKNICLRCSAVTSRVMNASETMRFVADTKTRVRHLPLFDGG